jgi:hypothetical protein
VVTDLETGAIERIQIDQSIINTATLHAGNHPKE